ncbi:hypothetical protein [Ancylobacter terrae]|uniref:hypothetical protein n=1 Tax=Ancylobacter sp. sgz301288 TaxID=3342077 RepID=UPI00385AA2FF
MPETEFDILTLSPSIVRLMHRNEHHIFEFALVDNGDGQRVVNRGPAIQFGRDGTTAAWNYLDAAQIAAVKAARDCGLID